MRIATFNLRSGGSRRHWNEILRASSADLLFVQESKNPASFAPGLFDATDLGPAHWAATAHGLWGSAQLARGASVEPIDVPAFNGWVTGGVVILGVPGASVVHAFSVHIPTGQGSYEKAANRLVDALKPIVGGGPVILGGDWNLTCGHRAPTETKRNTPGERKLLHRLEQELGVIPAWSTFHPGEPLPQTLRWTKEPLTPYHCDGVFLPSAWAPRIRAADVLSGDPWNELSDHNPVVVEWGEESAPVATSSD